MTDHSATAAAPLLGDRGREDEESSNSPWGMSRTAQAPSKASRAASRTSRKSRQSHTSDEQTPLLSRGDHEDEDDAASLDEPDEISAKKRRIRWPTLIGISLLSATVITILSLAFAAPAVAEKYAERAIVFKPSNLSVESFTSQGVYARVRGEFVVDGTRVDDKPVRDLGRLGTWFVGAVASEPTTVNVYLPQYDNILLGKATVPAITVAVRDGQVTPLDFVTEVIPGEVEGIRQIASDWLDGRLGSLQVTGKADIRLKSGIFGLGTRHVSHSLSFGGSDIPSMPQYSVTKALVHEIKLDGERAMAADVGIKAFNHWPVAFEVPKLAFEVMVRGCSGSEELVLLANATTETIDVQPNTMVSAHARGVVRDLPKFLVEECPGTDASPLDVLLRDYLHGSKATVFIRGSDQYHDGVPQWVSDLIKEVTVPITIPSRSFDGLIRNFTMAETHFDLPNPFADPDSPEGSPRVSTVLKVIANLPEEMNFPVTINRIRADSDVYYKKRKLGVLEIKEWQKANSTRIYPKDGNFSGIAIDAKIINAPLRVTDSDLFSEVVKAMLFGGSNIVLDMQAEVDVETHTALGKFVVKGVPASGSVPVKQDGGDGFDLRDLAPKIEGLEITDTTKEGVSMTAKVNVTNPTKYSATVPYVDINIIVNDTVVGHATAQNIEVLPGRNYDLPVSAEWNPHQGGGQHARYVAREFISQYISGYNTTLQVAVHAKSIPTLPELGRALANISLQIPTPRLKPPKNPNHDPDDPDSPDDEGRSRFIQDATMHLLSSSADFTLLSPLQKNTLQITHINATALYNHSEPIGFILYDVPFNVPPGASTTPRLPVEWDVMSVGYQAIREALGGSLKLDARAEISLRLQEWEQDLWYKGSGIGARVRV